MNKKIGKKQSLENDEQTDTKNYDTETDKESDESESMGL